MASVVRRAVEVRRRQTVNAMVFEFGSAAESGVAGLPSRLQGTAPSDDLETCRWELVPAAGEGTPQFKISS
jgi:hypothetical protein